MSIPPRDVIDALEKARKRTKRSDIKKAYIRLIYDFFLPEKPGTGNVTIRNAINRAIEKSDITPIVKPTRHPYRIATFSLKVPDISVSIFVPSGFVIMVPKDAKYIHVLNQEGKFCGTLIVTPQDLNRRTSKIVLERLENEHKALSDYEKYLPYAKYLIGTDVYPYVRRLIQVKEGLKTLNESGFSKRR